ncbi:Xaa-Pro peptidase family protein [Fodinisporobacter ferrooxydans]|uniref:Xaa-Pro peptidase family protein n=2 Tax=Fodinisporobacter ferrooxydans TaxID=2901836 RepID=A0ABY4CL16_9BACL|nr:Xaa-Pro peptidase family protein [Alicyclobacillaceae bacterium MYW30-H2]
MEWRLQRLQNVLKQKSFAAVLVMQPENRRYLTGFTGSSGMAVVTVDAAYLLTDSRYTEQAKFQSPHFAVIEHGPAQMFQAACQVLQQRSVRAAAFEEDFVTFDQYRQLVEQLPSIELVPVKGLVETLRLVKDEQELEIMRTAANIADAAFLHIVKWIRPGLSEREVALELEIFMRKQGASGCSFETIVASGPRSALPHGVASERVIQNNEFVTLDFGAVYQGYCSDITRTICMGTPDPRHKEIYGIVLEAQIQALAAIKPGMTGQEADAIARRRIEAHGFGECFGHSLGHGLGMAVHEQPRLSKISDDVLEPGMVVTVEPGIYIPDFGGVRIEDDIVITSAGNERLTHSAKELLLIR